MTKQYTFDLNIDDFNSHDIVTWEVNRITRFIKSNCDEGAIFQLCISGCCEDPNEKIRYTDNDTDHLSYEGLIRQLEELHLLYLLKQEHNSP